MDWTTVDFAGVTTEVEAMLPEIIPVLILAFGLILAVRLVPRVARAFTR